MTEDLILAIDHGTQSVRAILFDHRGRMVAFSRVPIEPYQSRWPGWAEQDPDYYWAKLCEACRRLWSLTEATPKNVVGVALTTQRATVVNVDKNGIPLRPAIVWLDQRRTEGLKFPGGLWGMAFRIIGNRETVVYLQAEAEANWIRYNEPEVWERTHKYLFLSGYLIYRLTGRFADSTGAQVGYVPFDYRRHRWASSWDWKWKVLPVTPSMLPELVPPGGELGRITKKAAEETSLPAGRPLIAAAADKACEVLGSGCLHPSIACLSYGTTATINTTHRKYIEAVPMIPPYPAAVPGAYSLETMIYRGFWMVSWFKDQFAHREKELAREMGVDTEACLEELITQSPPGAHGLVLQPYWSPGLKFPGPEARGAIVGFGDVHNRAHVYRAILEGLAYALREGKERQEEASGVPIGEIRIAGGGSRSDGAVQLTADVFGLPVGRPHIYDTSALGAAIDVAVGLGIYSGFDEAVRQMTRVGRYFEPNPAHRHIYDQLYRRVYRRLYDRLRPLYEEIHRIIG